MKAILLITALCLPSVFLNGQSVPDLKTDSIAITETALNYGEGWYSGDAARMEKAIHPDLNKVCPVVMPKTGKTFLIISSYSGLIEPTRAKAGLVDESERNIKVKILKINNNVACAKLTSAQFNDYLEMVKIEGQWKIVNVLWTFGEDSPNRKVMADFQGENEKAAIETGVRDFIEGIYTSDLARIEKVVHPEYRRATPIFIPSTGKTVIQRDAAGSVMEAVRAKAGAQPKDKWDIQVKVLDIMDGLAFAELSTSAGSNYAQMAKIDGQWKIINMLRKVNAQP
jgi:hypothetical protein